MFILVILYILEYLCVLTKLFTGTRVSEDFQFRVSGIKSTGLLRNSWDPHHMVLPQTITDYKFYFLNFYIVEGGWVGVKIPDPLPPPLGGPLILPGISAEAGRLLSTSL